VLGVLCQERLRDPKRPRHPRIPHASIFVLAFVHHAAATATLQLQATSVTCFILPC
jgi:hypothetical protein